jgi:hypothetical protein
MSNYAKIPYLIHSMISVERGAKLRKRLCPDVIILIFFTICAFIFMATALLSVAVAMGGLATFPGNFTLLLGLH